MSTFKGNDNSCGKANPEGMGIITLKLKRGSLNLITQRSYIADSCLYAKVGGTAKMHMWQNNHSKNTSFWNAKI